MDNENVYWAMIKKLDKRWDYLEISQTSKNRWSVTVDGHDYSVRTASTDPWDILYAALKLREKRQLSLQASSDGDE
jgi:hypothetical protein